MKNLDVPYQVTRGYRMGAPAACQGEIYQLMLQCWAETPRDRPDFALLRNTLISLSGRPEAEFEGSGGATPTGGSRASSVRNSVYLQPSPAASLLGGSGSGSGASNATVSTYNNPAFSSNYDNVSSHYENEGDNEGGVQAGDYHGGGALTAPGALTGITEAQDEPEDMLSSYALAPPSHNNDHRQHHDDTQAAYALASPSSAPMDNDAEDMQDAYALATPAHETQEDYALATRSRPSQQQHRQQRRSAGRVPLANDSEESAYDLATPSRTPPAAQEHTVVPMAESNRNASTDYLDVLAETDASEPLGFE